MFILVFLISLLPFSPPHALYLSTCEIEIADDYSWTGQLRIFHDDLEDAIFNHNGQRPHLSTDKINDHTGAVSEYLNEHLFIKSGMGEGSISVFKLIRIQDIVQIELSGHLPQMTKRVQVRNDLLLEIFEAQKNVMVIRKSGKVKTLYFKKNHTKDQLEF